MRTYSMVVHTGPDSGSTGQLPTPAKAHEARAIAALVLGICSIVLIYPLGILLGPLALWFGITGLRRINRSRLALAGSGLAIAGIGCGGLLLLACIGGGLLVARGCSKLKEVAGDFQKNPTKAAATLLVKANPDLELVGTNDAKGEMTIKDKKTGEVTTMSFDQLSQGKFKVRDAKGNETSVDASAAGKGRVVIKGADGQTMIGGAAAEIALPAWVPSYPGTATKEGGMRIEKEGAVSGMAMAESRDSVSKVKDFYDARLKAAGFKVESSIAKINGTENAMVNGTKEDGRQKVGAIINSDQGKTSIILTYEGPK